jgi:putative two-component system response regulator
MNDLQTVLIVDDEPAVRDLMARWAVSLGLRASTAANADEALATLRTRQYDLAVIDVMMPGHDGLWLAAALHREHPHTAVVLATAYTDLLTTDEAQERPLADLLIKPFQRDRFSLAVDRGRQWRKRVLEELRWHGVLTMEVRDRTVRICAEIQQRVANGATDIDALASFVWEQTPETAAHAERVARYAQSVAREMGVHNPGDRTLAIAAQFHDVGKAAMPTALLSKPSPLTLGEIAVMQLHVEMGAEILEAMPSLAHAAPFVLASHEWFSGGGYPARVSGAQIPLISRIIAAVDAYDAMTQDRSYRSRLDAPDAIGELMRCTPTQFDPDVVTAFLAILGRH